MNREALRRRDRERLRGALAFLVADSLGDLAPAYDVLLRAVDAVLARYTMAARRARLQP